MAEEDSGRRLVQTKPTGLPLCQVSDTGENRQEETYRVEITEHFGLACSAVL